MTKIKMPSIAAVSDALVWRKKQFRGEDFLREGIDVRLQVMDDGTWSVHTGDSQYDQDHRGYCGCGIADPDNNYRRVVEAKLALDLYEFLYEFVVEKVSSGVKRL